MALYGKHRDVCLFKGISRELVNDIIEQEIGYYKIYVNDTDSNVYGESHNKKYIGPVLLKTLIYREDQVNENQEYGPDVSRRAKFVFLKDDLININLMCEKGDVVLWNNDYYELDNIIENQLIVGKDNDYSITEHLNQFGDSFSIIVEGTYVRPEKLGIERVR